MDQDQDNLDRLREQARRRMEEDERTMPPPQVPAYGAPPTGGGMPRPNEPVTIYGAPPIGGLGRRRGLKYVLIALLAAIAGAVAWIFGHGPGPSPMAVYGGPPIVPVPPPNDSTKSTAPPSPPKPRPTPPNPVYGAPPPRPPQPPPAPPK
jgi:hypothetical protein